MSDKKDQQRISDAADNCEVLRARLAKYEDAEGRPLHFDIASERDSFEQFCAGFHRGSSLDGEIHSDPRYPTLNGQWIYDDWNVQSAWATWQARAALKAKPSGLVLPERKSPGEDMQVAGWNACLDEVARLNSSPVSPVEPSTTVKQSLTVGGVDERSSLATLERFVDTVRECYHLASSYSGCLDNVDEHGGDDHEDPICAVFHRLYYAMFDGDKALEQARASLSAPSHGEQVREGWRDGYRAAMNNAGWGVRELYVKHQHHHRVDGLLNRCKELEQSFIREADAMLPAAPSAVSQEQGE